jgi:putative DNA methylase
LRGKCHSGLALPFDVARRFAQPLGIHLDAWEGRCIETEKGIVRLIPVLDRAEQLFGQDGAEAVADRLETQRTGPVQLFLFAEMNEPTPPKLKGRKRKSGAEVSDESLHRHRGATTLDHVHAAMLLQSSGRSNALRALLKAETERGPDFLRLANALSALYPTGSDEKRLLDAMLLAVPR